MTPPRPTPTDRRPLDADQLTDALLAGEPEVERAVVAAVESLSAWRSFPPFVRRAFGRQSRRMATRAATAVVKLLEVVDDRRAISNTSRQARGMDATDGTSP